MGNAILFCILIFFAIIGMAAVVGLVAEGQDIPYTEIALVVIAYMYWRKIF